MQVGVLSNNFWDSLNAQIDIIGAGLDKGKKQVLIVPQSYVFEVQKVLLSRLQKTAVFDVTVTSLDRLFFDTLDSEKMLSNLASNMIVEKLLLKHQDKLKSFCDSQKTIAFAAGIMECINTLKKCDISYADLVSHIESVTSQSLRLKLEDIALIYRAYEEYKHGEVFDKLDCQKQLIDNISKLNLSDTEAHICLYSSFSVLEYKLLKTLSKSVNNMSIAIISPEEDQPNADLCKTEVLQELARFGFDIKTVRAKNERGSFTNHILSNLLAVTPRKMELNDNNQVRIYEAGNVRLEVEWVATDILNKILYHTFA